MPFTAKVTAFQLMQGGKRRELSFRSCSSAFTGSLAASDLTQAVRVQRSHVNDGCEQGGFMHDEV